MEDIKQRHRQTISWIAVVLVLWTLLFVLVGNYLTAARKEAISKAEEAFMNDVYTWSSQINSILQNAEVMGEMLGEEGLLSAESLELAARIVENTPIDHIYQVREGIAYLNERGEQISEKIPVSSGAGDEYIFGECMMAVLPLANSEKLVLQISKDYVADNCFNDSHREISFLSVADKFGNIIVSFDYFRDITSTFLTHTNFLDNVTGYKNAYENAGRFKTCYLNGIEAAIIAEYMNEKRMLVTSAIGNSGYSLVYGLRYDYAETAIEDYYVESRDTMIKILMVVFVFSAFIVGVVILSSMKNKERGRELETKADTDLLTELYNKIATERKIQDYLNTSPEGRGLLFILDIDNFKKINDTMGHAFGDTLLRTLGKEIKAEFRATDIIGRTGGDEFIVFLKNLNDDATIEHEANRLLRFFQDFKAGGDYVKYSATASIGAAIYPDDASNFKDLYVAADKALYRAKKRGKNQLCFFKER